MAYEPTRRVLLYCAHPDDEVFLCAKMKEIMEMGNELHVAWLTSGDLFGQGELREKELTLAADMLGIGPHNRHLFRLPDMGLVRHLRQATDFVTTLIHQVGPTHVFVPAYEGGHPDHDALNFVGYTVWQQIDRSFCLLEFPLYNGTGPFFFLWLRVNSFPHGKEKVEKHVLDDEEIALKTRLIDIYSSQPRSMLPVKLTHWWRRLMRSSVEQYALVPEDRDYQLRPHSGPLFYERCFNKHLNMTFEEFRETVANFKASMKSVE